MAKELRTSILLPASPQRVWELLTHFSNYPQWNPFIKSLEGDVREGNIIRVRIEPPGAKGMTFTPKVLRFEANKEFRWLGHFIFPGLFDGEHIFELQEQPDGSTLLIHREIFRGILVPFLKKMLDTNTRQGFEAMNRKMLIMTSE
jgi:hypothetical protein